MWNKKAKAEGKRARVFCASLADVFEFRIDAHMHDLNEWRDELWDLVASTPWLDWLFLTKRPQHILELIPLIWYDKNFSPDAQWPDNVHFGTSIENQDTANERIPAIMELRHAHFPNILFLSIEPLLGPVDLTNIDATDRWDEFHSLGYGRNYWGERGTPPINWVIVGGESGPNARPMKSEWAQKIRDDCRDAEVKFFFKQWGAWLPNDQTNGERTPKIRTGDFERLGKKKAGRYLDGCSYNDHPWNSDYELF